MNQRGRFIVFEGGEACGKSTQARRLAERLDALFTFEPGATDLGRLVREMVLDSMGVRGPAERSHAPEAVCRAAK